MNGQKARELEVFRRTKIAHIESEFDRAICEHAFRNADKFHEMFGQISDEDDVTKIYKAIQVGHLATGPANMLKIDVEMSVKHYSVKEGFLKQLHSFVIESIISKWCAGLARSHSKIAIVMTSTTTSRTFSTALKKYDQWAFPVIWANLFDNEANCLPDLKGKFRLDIAVVHDVAKFELMKQISASRA